MEHINPFNPLLSQFDKFAQQEGRTLGWESARVDWTLKRLNLTAERREIQASSETKRYTFDEFNRVVETFPMRIFAEHLTDEPAIHRDSRSVHPVWFKDFRKLPFVKRYETRFEELYSRYPDRPLAMVFPRKGFAQGLVIHNGGAEKFVPMHGGCHLYRAGHKHAMQLVVQAYSGLIDHIRDELAWRM